MSLRCASITRACRRYSPNSNLIRSSRTLGKHEQSFPHSNRSSFRRDDRSRSPNQWCDQAKIRYSPQEVSYDVHRGVGLHIGTTSRTLQETKQVVSIRPYNIRRTTIQQTIGSTGTRELVRVCASFFRQHSPPAWRPSTTNVAKPGASQNEFNGI